jgi:hypothetical protein
MRIAAAVWDDKGAFSGDHTGIAARSGRTPMMFMTRVRL